MNTTHNGFRFAELARGESLQSPETCDCCGREGLKKTVKLISPSGSVVWYGTGCAARAMSCKPLTVRKAREAQIDAAHEVELAEKRARDHAELARWQAFLDLAAPSVPKCWDGRSDTAEQIAALGGVAAARAAYRAAHPNAA
jgi:hypothetical protein